MVIKEQYFLGVQLIFVIKATIPMFDLFKNFYKGLK